MKKYKIIFCRRNPKDSNWRYRLTPEATFIKSFESLEEAARFTFDNVYVDCCPTSDTRKTLNEDSRIVIWDFRFPKQTDERIFTDKLFAMVIKRYGT